MNIFTPHTTEYVAVRDLDGSISAVNQYFAEINNLDVIGAPAPNRHMALMDCQEWEFANRYCCNLQRRVSPLWIDFANKHFIDTDFDEDDSYYEDYLNYADYMDLVEESMAESMAGSKA